MGCFAVLQWGAGPQVCVHRCHVNLWSLPGLLGHRPMVIDIGLLVGIPQDQEGRLEEITVAVPGALEPGVEDLYARMRRPDVAKLVFGNALAPGTDDDTLMLFERDSVDGTPRVGDPPLRVRRLALQKASALDEARSETNVSVVSLKPVAPLQSGELGYVRARMRYHRPGRMWVWRRVLSRRDSALVDFRIADPREAATVKDGARLEAEMKKITLESVDVFVMAPDSYHLAEANPPLAYSRLLEGAAWTPYISGLRGGYGESKLVVHHWRAANVSVEKPFRAFLALRRRPAFAAPTDAVVTALAVVLLGLAILAPLEVRAGLRGAVGDAFDAVNGLLVAAIGAFSIGLAITLLRLVPKARSAGRAVKRWLTARERSLLALRDPRA